MLTSAHSTKVGLMEGSNMVDDTVTGTCSNPEAAGGAIDFFDDDDDSDFAENDEERCSRITGGDSSMIGEKEKERTDIAQEESQMVFVARVIVILLVLGLAVGMAFAVNKYLTDSQSQAFQVDFYNSRNLILEQLELKLETSIDAIDGLMANLVSYQQSSHSSWPFVTKPNFSRLATFSMSTSAAFLIGVYPRVLHDQRENWENYTATHNSWVEQQSTSSAGKNNNNTTNPGVPVFVAEPSSTIHSLNGPLPPQDKYYPLWQSSPFVPNFSGYNFDIYPTYFYELDEIEKARTVIMGRTQNIPTPGNNAEQEEFRKNVAFVSEIVGSSENPASPFFPLLYPIVSRVTDSVISSQLDRNSSRVVGVLSASLFWHDVFDNILSPATKGLIVVLGTGCGQNFTYQIDGPSAFFLGTGDLHDPKYSRFGTKIYLHSLISNQTARRPEFYTGFPLSSTYCPYYMYIYPSDISKQKTANKDIILITGGVVAIFGLTILFFFIYDFASERRQQKVLKVALQSTAIVANLFPKVVQDRLFLHKSEELPKVNNERLIETAKLSLQKFLRNEGQRSKRYDGDRHQNLSPIAELFTDTTVLFADIAGFTAWSSVREPAQVFTLLETLYSEFDSIASRRRVFKVETIGDCYVAVAGLPEPSASHAISMCKFARDIRDKMDELTRVLARSLGPDTIDLKLRIGVNSGPVTAGVLRGERSRFQLFGDTVNIASRMESTGVVSKIHISPSTAFLLQDGGKGHWLTKREDGVLGHGKFQTYWVEPGRQSRQFLLRSAAASEQDSSKSVFRMSQTSIELNSRHLLDWNVDILGILIKKIVAQRKARQQQGSRRNSFQTSTQKDLFSPQLRDFGATIPLDEVCEVVMLPEFDSSLTKYESEWDTIDLGDVVTMQLRTYVAMIATMYREHPFHNFEHASHVTMSVVKLLSRIVAPTDDVIEIAATNGNLVQTLHDHTFGITSDPLTQFACIFSALIHDVDHPGIPNTQLIQEGSSLISVYKGKSLAEQNSIDIAWNLFMESEFEDLRNVICDSQVEMARLRQLVVNVVMATDIMDKDLKALRNERWEKAFNDSVRSGETLAVNVNRKATIVIEHLIQASDVAHTMQHWHVYQKWNERLFEEMHNAYIAGRAERNPADYWYKGELGFFDFYIIPLARKLRDCGVFGVSSDEYLSYALKNREEWERRGMEIVASVTTQLNTPVAWLQDNSEESENSLLNVATQEFHSRH